MTFKQGLRLIARHRLLVAIVCLLGLGLGVANALRGSTTYTATSAIVVNPGKPDRGVDVGGLNSYIIARMETYDAMATSASVLNPVISELKLDEKIPVVQQRISLSIPTGSSILQISASADSPAEAVKLADATAASLQSAIEGSTPPQPSGAAAIEVQSIQKGEDAQVSTRPSPVTDGFLGMVLGLVIATLICWLYERMRSRPQPTAVERRGQGDAMPRARGRDGMTTDGGSSASDR